MKMRGKKEAHVDLLKTYRAYRAGGNPPFPSYLHKAILALRGIYCRRVNPSHSPEPRSVTKIVESISKNLRGIMQHPREELESSGNPVGSEARLPMV